jgi:hypothetical protein
MYARVQTYTQAHDSERYVHTQAYIETHHRPTYAQKLIAREAASSFRVYTYSFPDKHIYAHDII